MGEGTVYVEGIKTNGIILLHAFNRLEVAVMDVTVNDAPGCSEDVGQFVKNYVQMYGMDDERAITTQTMLATIIGGNYREIRQRQRGDTDPIFTYVNHDLVSKKARAALIAAGIPQNKVRQKKANRQAILSVTIGSRGRVRRLEESFEGYNKHSSQMSDEIYLREIFSRCLD
jgi:hypothetical protein